MPFILWVIAEGNFHVYLQTKIYIVKCSQTGLDFYAAKKLSMLTRFQRFLCCQKPFLLPKTWTNIQCWPVFRGPAKCIRPDSPWPTCQPSPRVHKFHKSKYQCCRKFRKINFSRENWIILQHRREARWPFEGGGAQLLIKNSTRRSLSKSGLASP